MDRYVTGLVSFFAPRLKKESLTHINTRSYCSIPQNTLFWLIIIVLSSISLEKGNLFFIYTKYKKMSTWSVSFGPVRRKSKWAGEKCYFNWLQYCNNFKTNFDEIGEQNKTFIYIFSYKIWVCNNYRQQPVLLEQGNYTGKWKEGRKWSLESMQL